MTEVEKLHGLHNTGMTMHQRFTLLAQQSVGRRGKRNPLSLKARTQRNPAFIEALYNQLENEVQRFQPMRGMFPRGRGRGRGGLQRAGSEGSIRSVGFRKGRSNSFGDINQPNKDQRWRRSNGNLSMNGSVYSERAASVQSRGYWLRGDAVPRRALLRGRGRPRGRGRGGRGRVQEGRVNRVWGVAGGAGRAARGSGRRGARRALSGAPRDWRRRGSTRGRGRGRGGIPRNNTPAQKPVPTKEELDEQLEQYMAGTKAALDKELDEYMRNAMDFD